MLPRQHRLRTRTDIGAVFEGGLRGRHRLIMMVYRPNLTPDRAANKRFCFVASKKVGNAIRRNRAKRLMREAVHAQLEMIAPGWDCIFIARHGTPYATLQETEAAVTTLLQRAGLCVVAP